MRTGRPGMHPSVWQVTFRHRFSCLSGSLPFHEAHRARLGEHWAHKFQSYGVPSKAARFASCRSRQKPAIFGFDRCHHLSGLTLK